MCALDAFVKVHGRAGLALRVSTCSVSLQYNWNSPNDIAGQGLFPSNIANHNSTPQPKQPFTKQQSNHDRASLSGFEPRE